MFAYMMEMMNAHMTLLALYLLQPEPRVSMHREAILAPKGARSGSLDPRLYFPYT
jgi:hypothetical protein